MLHPMCFTLHACGRRAARTSTSNSSSGLRSLSLSGRVGMCGGCVAALSGVTGLEELGLSKVQLIYDQVCMCVCMCT